MDKKIMLFVIIGYALLILTSCSSVQPAQNNTQPLELVPDAADSEQLYLDPVIWGDSIAIVKTKELGELLDETEEALSYNSTILGLPSKIFYRFEGDKLYCVFTVTEIDFVDSEKIFEFYDNIKQELNDRFGISTSDEVISTNPQKAITGDGHNELLQGNAFLTTEWDLKDYYAKIQVSPDETKAFISVTVEKKPEFVAQEIYIGNTYEVAGLCEFVINYAELKKEVNPPKPVDYYTYYSEQDGKTYLDIAVSIKNKRTTSRQADQFGYVKAVCGDGYEYTAFSVIEEKNGGDFTYTNIKSIDPLETGIIHYLISIPNELADDELSSIVLEMTILENDYKLIVR